MIVIQLVIKESEKQPTIWTGYFVDVLNCGLKGLVYYHGVRSRHHGPRQDLQGMPEVGKESNPSLFVRGTAQIHVLRIYICQGKSFTGSHFHIASTT